MNINIKTFYATLFLLLSILTSSAQTINDSLKYSELINSLLSKNGKIAVIHKYYKPDSKRDSVFIYNEGKLIDSKQSNFNYRQFKNNSIISYNTNKKEIEILNGHTLKNQIIPNVTKPIIIENYGLLFYLNSSTKIYNLVQILQKGNKVIWTSPKDKVSFTDVSDDKQNLIIQYSNKQKGIEIINLTNFKKTVNKEIKFTIKQAIWSKKHPIVFLLPNSIGDNKYPFVTFYHYNNNFIKKQVLNDSSYYHDLESTSNNSFKIIRTYNSNYLPYNTKKVELWSTNDRYLRNAISKAGAQTTTTNEHTFFNYTNNEATLSEKLNNYESISLNENTFLVFDSNQYLDYTYQWSSRPRDISIYNIKEDTLTVIVKQLNSPFNTTSLSPKGNYFIYSKENTLHFYNTNERIIENTLKLKKNNELKKVRLRTWSQDERFFYFSANSNLMRYDTKTKTFKTIISSNSADLHYSVLNSSNNSTYNANSELYYHSLSNNNNLLLVKKWDSKKNTQSLVVLDNEKQNWIVKDTENRISNIKYSDDLKSITYSLENFNNPKSVYLFQKNKTILLLENKITKEHFSWQKQKIISYKDKYGNNLKGVLFYPKDFDPNKKYPMITHIYEIQNQIANIFTYPTYLNSNGFNITLLQENKYFVFLPDIFDTQQGTGLSALHCVEQAIDSVLKQEKSIDKNNLGLYGFSHGGYETNFIITQNHMFKAAVSGSGNSDIIRSYFSYNENFVSPFFFQFENGQYKMPKTFKEDKDLYLKNSPILYTDQIKTPLLTFTGKKDENIHWEQQREFFIAMLRYKIPHVALFYNNEGHGLLKKENQIDITKRLIQWFDYFLKDIDTKEANWVYQYTTFEEERITNN
ncbi:alpha/beta hydrolase family protein [Myroides profundi]|uniref:Dipeptidyl aminopeptidase/acylaminoacyl peptidase n=1 Tax=Myroides profundi TaxID=480520 RepID=A0AAJ4W6Z4_MYRPR|nr:prolyl oligopeptidase family serine peptidase [Myroides profundi]AJH15333.1 peptidase S9 prolyl oligopeptidase [Myroides profundi]SER62534.1 Dipeptidyl aminopeptidase/acylaminoacyl peptidase [Myroides profundi]